MKSKGTIIYHPNINENSNFFIPEGNPTIKSIYRGLKMIFYQIIRMFPFSWSLLRVARGRKPILDKSCQIIEQGNQDYIYFGGGGVFNAAQYPEQTPKDYVIFTKQMQNAHLVGPGLVPIDKNGYLASEAVNISRYKDFNEITAESIPVSRGTACQVSGAAISLVAHWTYWKAFYHWYLEVLPRLMHLEDHHKILVRDPISNYERECLELLGLLDRCEMIREDSVKVEDYLYISPSSLSGACDPQAIDFIRNLFLDKLSIKPSAKNKIYITRQGERRCPGNELQVTDLFRNAGWDIIDCKALSVKEQIECFSMASHVAASHGGALANLLWAPECCEVVEFFPSNRIVATNENIALHLGMSYTAMVFPHKSRDPVTIDIEWISEVLKLGTN